MSTNNQLTSMEELLQQQLLLKEQLRTAEETLDAIRSGTIDAILVNGINGPQVYSLQGADHTYKTIVERMVEGAVLINKDGLILYSNSQFAHLMHIPQEAVIGSSFRSMVHVAHAFSYEDMMEKVWHAPVKGEVMLSTGKQKALPVYLSMNTIDSAQGQVIGMTVTDLSDQKERKNFESLFAQAPAIINLFRGPEHIFEIVHPSSAALLKNPHLKGVPLREVHGPLKDADFAAILDRVYASGEAFEQKEVLLEQPDADGIPQKSYFNISYQPWFDRHHRVQGVMTYRIDVTEQVLARQRVISSARELSIKNEELIRINSDLDNFVYAASHDLKAPVSNIEGLIELLTDKLKENNAFTEDSAEFIDMINHSIEKFKETIGDLTEVTKIQQNQAEDSSEPLNCYAVIADVMLSIQSMIEQTKAQITLDLGGCEGFYFSKRNFKSIIYNLLSNAIKYRADDRVPIVHIAMKRYGGQRILTVQDNGIGMDLKHDGARIFSMFKRLHDHVEGSGIGLYLVKRIMDNTAGTIEVKSEVGKGTTFILTFNG